MKGECNVARDLMPLCIDGAASAESKRYVEEHAEECETCRTYYYGMRAALPSQAGAQAEAERGAFSRMAARMRRRRIARALIVALAAVVALTGALAGAYRFFFVETPLPASACAASLARLQNGTVILTVKTNQPIEAYDLSFDFDQSALDALQGLRVWRVQLMSGRFPRRASVISVRTHDVTRVLEMPSLAAVVYGKNEIIWRPGDEIAPASAEMEAYYAAVSAYEAYMWEVEKMHTIENLEKGDTSSVHFTYTSAEREEMERLKLAVEAARALVPEWR